MHIEQRLSTTITVMIILAFILGLAVGLPAVLSIRVITGQMADENLQIEKAYALRRLTSNTEAVVANAHKRIASLGQMDIVEGDELTFISDMENAAAESKITQDLQLETVNQIDINAWEKEIPLKLKASGDFSGIIVYLHKIEALPFYIILRNLKITTDDQSNQPGEGKVGLNLEAVVRWRTKGHPAYRSSDGAVPN